MYAGSFNGTCTSDYWPTLLPITGIRAILGQLRYSAASTDQREEMREASVWRRAGLSCHISYTEFDSYTGFNTYRRALHPPAILTNRRYGYHSHRHRPFR